MKEKRIKTAKYKRVSKKEQAIKGFSLQAQDEVLDEYIEKKTIFNWLEIMSMKVLLHRRLINNLSHIQCQCICIQRIYRNIVNRPQNQSVPIFHLVLLKLLFSFCSQSFIVVITFFNFSVICFNCFLIF